LVQNYSGYQASKSPGLEFEATPQQQIEDTKTDSKLAPTTKALSMRTETIIASFLGQTVAGFPDHEFWIQSDQLAGELYNRRYNDRRKAEQVARNCNSFFATARAKG
jgi:hypothetical protein